MRILRESNPGSREADVLVVGAGPTGLTVAISLLVRGRQVTIVDKQPEPSTTSRAAVVYARTLEVLDPYGVAERLAAQGIHAPRFTIRDRDTVLMPIGFTNLPTAFPYTLLISQAATEAALLRRLTELGGEVLRSCMVTRLDQDESGVTATLEGGEQIRARYVVGADGMHSTVRQQAGISFPVTSGASFSLADVHLTGGVPGDEVVVYFSPAGHLVVVPLPGGIHRIVANVSEAPEHPEVPYLQQFLDTRGPEANRAVIHDVVWGSRFLVHHTVAERYRIGHVVLAGDAAHVHSPLGGQGMNLGITDAVALGRALSGILEGGSPDLLEDYDATRRPIARQVVSLTDLLTTLAVMQGRSRQMRNLALGVLNPILRRRLAWRLSGLAYR